MIFIIIILTVLCIYFFYKSRQTISYNKDISEQNKQLEKDLSIYEAKIESLVQQQERIETSITKLKQTELDMREGAFQDVQQQAQQYYDSAISALTQQYNEEEKKLELQRQTLLKQIQLEQKNLSDLEAKQLAYIQAKQREEAISADMDYYRLALDQLDINDIELLRELQPRFVKKETIDKIIWDAYYKPAFDVLSAHLFQTAGTKVCGIYKLTDQITGQSYVGQSVDMRERFRTHIKTALTYGKASNKLYQAMQKDGLHNFTFEILEEVPRSDLNDREAYWIGFYKTKEFGLNGTKGNTT